MRLEELHVRALPGIEAPFSLSGLGAGVNVLIGPNASGKSSVVRALRALLYGEEAKGEAVHLHATFRDGERRLSVTRLGDTLRWERDGAPCAPPALPEHHQLDAYLIGIEDLGGTTALDGRIATRIAHELAGGFDLGAVRDGFRGTAGRKEAVRLRDAERELAAHRARRDALARRVARLDELRAEARRATHEAERRAAVDTALAAVEAEEERRDLEAALVAAFPPDMDALGGREDGTLDRLEAELAAASERAAVARRDLARAAATLEATGVAEHALAPHAVAERKEAATRLATVEHDLAAAEERAAAADAALAALLGDRGTLPGGGERAEPLAPDAGPALSPAAVAELSALADRRDEAAAERRDAERRVNEAREASETTEDPDPLRLPRQLLEGWLAAPEPRAVRRPSRVAPWLALLPPPFAAGAGWALATDATELAASLGVATLLALAGAVRAGRPRPHPRANERAAIEREYADAGGEPPPAWTLSAVREAHLGLARRIAEAEATAERERRRERRLELLEADLEQARASAETADRAFENAAAARRVPAHAFDAGLAARLGWVHAVREARAERERCRARRDALAADAESRRDALKRFLADTPLQLEAHAPAEAIRVRLDALESRLRDRDRARSEREAAEHELAQARREHAAALERQRDLFDACRLALPADADRAAREEAATRLRERLRRLPEWRRQAREIERLEGLARGYRARLAPAPDLLALAEARDVGELRRLRTAAEAAAARAKEANDRIVATETEAGVARGERAVERARTEAAAARDALEGVLDEALTAALGGFLVDRVEAHHHGIHRPAVLARAGAWFERFTHHAFRIDFDPGREAGDRLRARDVGEDRVLPLARLSTGTRAQLLLALRVAHALRAEEGRASLPLVLDEALTTTDAERFARVAEALQALVLEDGRQVFYLSARRSDAALWRDALGDDAVRTLDLAEIRGRAGGTPAERYALPAPVRVPEGRDTSAEAFAAALGVPPVRPWAIDALHPFHLLRDDLPRVARLATLRVTSLAALEAVLAQEGPGAAGSGGSGRSEGGGGVREGGSGSGPPDDRVVRARCAAARAWAARWRVGRGRPVTLDVLRTCVSDTFLGGVATLAEAHGGDAGALLDALRDGGVPRFGPQRIEGLEEALLEHGCLSERPPLGDGERVSAVAAALRSAVPDLAEDEAAPMARMLDDWWVAGTRVDRGSEAGERAARGAEPTVTPAGGADD